MKNFISFIDRLSVALNNPLPGREAQFLMEPVTRKTELKRQRNRADAKLSSVLILLYPTNESISTVMIRRPEYEGVHSGQIAFPGGRIEKEDNNLIETALRETEEEIGIKKDTVKVLGTLTNLYIPPSNYDVLPVVGYTESKLEFILQKEEVASILEIDINEFCNSDNICHKKILTRHNTRVSIICYFIQNQIIWGASAMIISEFVEILKKINLKS